MSAISKRSVDSVYEEIAGLTGNRAEMERQRFMLIKAIRTLKAIRDDSALSHQFEPEGCAEIDMAIEKLEAIKKDLWTIIESTDSGIQRLTDLVQNGAYNG